MNEQFDFSNKKSWTAKDVIKLQQLIANLNVESLSKAIITEIDGHEFTIADTVQDHRPGPEEIVERKELIMELLSYVKKLKPRESMVIRMRYGLDDGIFRTLDECGKYFGVTRERIRQIEFKAINKLKNYILKKYNNINDF